MPATTLSEEAAELADAAFKTARDWLAKSCGANNTERDRDVARAQVNATLALAYECRAARLFEQRR